MHKQLHWLQYEQHKTGHSTLLPIPAKDISAASMLFDQNQGGAAVSAFKITI